MTEQEAITQLKHQQSVKRRAAAKLLRKKCSPAAAAPLLSALEAEVRDRRTWETQYQLVMAVGICAGTSASALLRRISQMDLEPMVHLATGDALIRLAGDKNRALEDALSDGPPMRTDGALRAVAMTRYVPSQSVIRKILAYASPKQHQQARLWVAAAAAGWEGPEVAAFLSQCLLDDIANIQSTARASLGRTHLDWHPL